MTESAVLWLPASALACYEGSAALRSWLLTPGLLTQRVRELDPASFALNVLREGAEGGDHLREIELTSRGRAWIFAQTRVPAATLAAQPWLAQIGGRSLGEALAAHGKVARSDFGFAQRYPDVPLIARALQRAGVTQPALAPPLWTRYSKFDIGGAALHLQEVFLPVVAEQGTAMPDDSADAAVCSIA